VHCLIAVDEGFLAVATAEFLVSQQLCSRFKINVLCVGWLKMFCLDFVQTCHLCYSMLEVIKFLAALVLILCVVLACSQSHDILADFGSC